MRFRAEVNLLISFTDLVYLQGNMQRFLSTLAIMALIQTTIMAQTITLAEATTYADQLVRLKILNEKGKKALLKQISENKVELEHSSTTSQVTYTSSKLSRGLILWFCGDAFRSGQAYRLFKQTAIEKRIPPEDSVLPRIIRLDGFGTATINDDYIHPTRSTLGGTRTRTLNDFKQSGLIDENVYKECLVKLQDGRMKDEPELVSFMAERAIYYEYYDFNRKEQESYIEKLTDNGILTKEAQRQLIASYKPYELKSIPGILAYCDRYRLVDLNSFEPDPSLIYPVIFDSIKSLLPDFDYHSLKADIKETKESDLIRQDILLSFMTGEETYSALFYHDYKRQIEVENDKEPRASKVDQDFHKGINRWLTDNESAYRLYTVNIADSGGGVYGENKLGLLLLKDGEAALISEDVNLLSRETFDNRLSKKNIATMISELSALDMFSHLSLEQIDSAKRNLASSDVNSLEEVLMQFPATVVVFDWETGNLENPYEELTKKFVAASRGALPIIHTVDEYNKGWKKAKKVKYGFTIRGKKYETMLAFKDDWLDPAFLGLIKRAIKENHIDGNLIYCMDNGQEGGYIFLNARQEAFIRNHYKGMLKE